MFAGTKLARDSFTFSLRGVAAVNSHAFVPVVALDGVNRAWTARRVSSRRPSRLPPTANLVRQVESVLARYFAHGCCHAA